MFFIVRITGNYVFAYMAGLARSWNPPITSEICNRCAIPEQKENTQILV